MAAGDLAGFLTADFKGIGLARSHVRSWSGRLQGVKGEPKLAASW